MFLLHLMTTETALNPRLEEEELYSKMCSLMNFRLKSSTEWNKIIAWMWQCGVYMTTPVYKTRLFPIILEHNCRFSLRTHTHTHSTHSIAIKHRNMFKLQRHHYHLTCTEQVGWPTALWEHKLLPESGRPGNIGTQNPAGEPQSYQTLNRVRLTQNMWGSAMSF